MLTFIDGEPLKARLLWRGFTVIYFVTVEKTVKVIFFKCLFEEI